MERRIVRKDLSTGPNDAFLAYISSQGTNRELFACVKVDGVDKRTRIHSRTQGIIREINL